MNIHQLISQSRESNDLLTVEATVITGFEFIALDECREKCKPITLTKSKGRIFFNIHSSDFKKVLSLRSVDNIFLVAQTFETIPFEGKKDNDLEVIKSLVDKIQWDIILNKWIEITSFQGIVYPSVKKKIDVDESVNFLTPQEKSIEIPYSENCAVENESNELVMHHLSDESAIDKSKTENIKNIQLEENSLATTENPTNNHSDSFSKLDSQFDLENRTEIHDDCKSERKLESSKDLVISNCGNDTDISKMICTEVKKERIFQNEIVSNDEIVKGDTDVTVGINDNPSSYKKNNRDKYRKKNKFFEQRKSGKRRGQESVERQSTSKAGDILRFRATCNRVGENHSFSSMEAACDFGGTLQDKFGWCVDLTRFDLNVVLNIEKKQGYVCIAITHESLHRRNITHFSNTTLRATMCYNLFRLAEPMTGEIIIDPLCGGGSIPIEGALSFPKTFHICGDYNGKAIERTRANIDYLNNKEQLKISAIAWNVKHLPLLDQSVDILITDLPFGKRSGSKQDNLKLYIKVLFELARVVRIKTGRACLMTHDKTSFIRALRIQNEYWREIRQFGVNQGGLFSTVFLLLRKATTFTVNNNESLEENKTSNISCEELPVSSIDGIAEQKTCETKISENSTNTSTSEVRLKNTDPMGQL